ncbi:hypothetical protein M8C21_012681 [Ambrosia artemisiifolia]|uniref:DUF7642 domain-containing protein n=1 Tax=Ambrosia artemisiifolia TaxID=4212 RepID=A0AAD5GBP1_AMBAR|nr:hypothetical protein M8C21_012681 [Ambrosia artemisiifolia]
MIEGEMEKGLLCDDDDEVLCSASFQEAEDDFIKLKTTQWILYSFLLLFAWGFGFLMLLYLPFHRYTLRRIIRSRRLYITPHAIVYKVTKPYFGIGVFKKEKHVLLASVADVVIEQGYLQSRHGLYSLRIQNLLAVRRPPSDDLQIEAITNPQPFRKAVLTRLSSITSQALSSTLEDVGSSTNIQAPMSNVGELAILEKLEEVGNSLKRVQSLIEGRQPKASLPTD